ncbi:MULTISPECIES: sulfur carrier protein ThiS [unclassified Roseovarius]|uniref:sulfur carrier protein ThiS n=1 Tax=unclassified Roseovarius TaxID=2614913 RepID=UPI00273FA5A7|nr:sulfur carrier protein ThiS [Roseovarius sp. MMSF_3350]
MRLQLNGTQVDAEVATLAELLTAQGYGDAKVATAVNGTFVPATLRPAHALADGDSIEVLAPMQGG